MTDTRVDQKPPLLAACAITKGFPGVWEHLILDHIDFDVRAGEVHTLLGENGAGKTTLMRILVGVLNENRGSIFINGQKLAETRETFHGAIGYLKVNSSDTFNDAFE